MVALPLANQGEAGRVRGLKFVFAAGVVQEGADCGPHRLSERIAEVGRRHQPFERLGVDFVIVIHGEALDLVRAVEVQLLAGCVAAPAAERGGDHRAGVGVDGYHVGAENSCDE